MNRFTVYHKTGKVVGYSFDLQSAIFMAIRYGNGAYVQPNSKNVKSQRLFEVDNNTPRNDINYIQNKTKEIKDVYNNTFKY